MLKRVGVLLLTIATISGCYFPSEFSADLQLDREGRYRFTYVGKLTDVSMARRLMRGDLQGRANGTVVRMRHNARRGTLSFNIDGESGVEATQTRVPARVRPWVQMFKGDDRVTIVAATQRQSAGARGSRLA